MSQKKIQSALISVYDKSGLDRIASLLKDLDIKIYSTGGTYTYLESRVSNLHKVEDLTSYPSILGGRVKTLHPKVFGGILAMRNEDHLGQLNTYEIPEIDLVIVDLYPFEDTVKSTDDEATIIEKIDIGGIALIRAAAKNFKDVVVVPSKDQYKDLEAILDNQGLTTLEDRKQLAAAAFNVSSHYDTLIHQYILGAGESNAFKISEQQKSTLRYGENPHQKAWYYGDMSEIFDKLSGKELSFNNLVDVDAAIQIMAEFEHEKPSFAVLKHTNTCGMAIRDNVLDAWKAALAGDPTSAFGGILISNTKIDLATAKEIDTIFYEVLIAPDFSEDAFEYLTKKSKRILLKIKSFDQVNQLHKSCLNGTIVQDKDNFCKHIEEYECVTNKKPSEEQLTELGFAVKLCKHLKSNTIVLTKGHQLIGMGCGQTSRVDAANQAMDKAKRMGFEIEGAVVASDAFFPFPDCVEIAFNEGVRAVVQPGGSIKDQLSIDFCNQNDMTMMFTKTRHFKH